MVNTPYFYNSLISLTIAIVIRLSCQAEISLRDNTNSTPCALNLLRQLHHGTHQLEVSPPSSLRIPACSVNEPNAIKFWYTLDDFCKSEGGIFNYFASVRTDGSRECVPERSISQTECLTNLAFTYDSMTILNSTQISSTIYIGICSTDLAGQRLKDDSAVIYTIRQSGKIVSMNFYEKYYRLCKKNQTIIGE